MTTLNVTVGESDSLENRTRDRIEAAEAGAELDDVQPVLNFESYADLARVLTETNLELLEAIVEHEPGSMRETAGLVGRDFKEVHRNLTDLEALDVIEFEANGRAKRPVVRYDDIEIAIDLGDGNAEDSGETQASA